MNKEELDVIRARCEAATPGKWAYFVNKYNDHIISVHPAEYQMRTDLTCRNEKEIAYSTYTADLEFIAHARQDIPALIEAVEILEKAMKGLPGSVCCLVCVNRRQTCGSCRLKSNWRLDFDRFGKEPINE